MPWITATCPISKHRATVNSETAGDRRTFRCPQCGEFHITTAALAGFAALSVAAKLKRFVDAKSLAGDKHPVTITV